MAFNKKLTLEGLKYYHGNMKAYMENRLDERTGYIIFPEFKLDANTGHLYATGGKGVNFTINENGHLESEVQ